MIISELIYFCICCLSVHASNAFSPYNVSKHLSSFPKHLKSSMKPYSYKRGVCRPLEEESSFCLGLSTRPVSEIVPVCLNPRIFSSHYFVVMRFLEK